MKTIPFLRLITVRPRLMERMVFQVIPRLHNLPIHLPHNTPQPLPKPPQHIPLPRIILRIHPTLHLLIIHHTHRPEPLLRLRIIKRPPPRLLDFREKLLPGRERVAQSGEDGFGLEIPERLELEPFGHVCLDEEDFGLDQGKRSRQRIRRKLGELVTVKENTSQSVFRSLDRWCKDERKGANQDNPKKGSEEITEQDGAPRAALRTTTESKRSTNYPPSAL